MMTFGYWLKNIANKDQQKEFDTTNMTWTEKRVVLSRWLIWKARNFTMDLEVATTQSFNMEKKTEILENWWSFEQIESHFGMNKAKGIIDKGNLKHRPCRQSLEPNLQVLQICL